MGWFQHLFRPYPKRDQWAAISFQIASGFDSARVEWFDFCEKLIRRSDECSDAPTNGLNTELNGQIVNVLKAYQIGSVSAFVRSQRWIRKSDANEFSDLVLAQVCGTEMPAVVGHFQDFLNIAPEARDIYLANRVAEHLTQQEIALFEGFLLTTRVHAFYLASCISVAYAFGDKLMTAKLNNLMDVWFERHPEQLRHSIDSMSNALQKMAISPTLGNLSQKSIDN